MASEIIASVVNGTRHAEYDRDKIGYNSACMREEEGEELWLPGSKCYLFCALTISRYILIKIKIELFHGSYSFILRSCT